MLLQSPADDSKDDVELSYIPKVKEDLLYLELNEQQEPRLQRPSREWRLK